MFYGTSDIVTNIQSRSLADGSPAERVSLKGGPVLVLSEQALALYRDEAAPDDPLGNGLISLGELPESNWLQPEDGRFIKEHRAGYIGLFGGQAILITPATVQLFANRDDALRNRNQVVRLAFDD